MQSWSLPLIIATAAFLAVLLWRVRPAFLGGQRRASREALRAANERVSSAADDAARAAALCDAAELVVANLGGPANAAALFQRAMRAAPGSAEVVARAARTLAHRPRALEALLWRRLAATPWDATSMPAIRKALDALRSLYERGGVKNGVRARALGHARAAIESSPPGPANPDK
jgi:hypothetical protein